MGMLTLQSFSKIEYCDGYVKIGDIRFDYNEDGIALLLSDVSFVMDDLTDDLDSAKDACITLEEELDSISDDKQEEIYRLEDTIQDLKYDISDLKSELEVAREKRDEAIERSEMLAKKVSKLENEINDLKTKLNQG